MPNTSTHPNLTPFKPGEQRAKEAGRKGGIASGEAKRERFKALLLAELDGEAQVFIAPKDDFLSLESIFDKGHYEPAGYTVRAALAKALIAKAKDGDLKALDMVLRLTEGGDENDEAASA